MKTRIFVLIALSVTISACLKSPTSPSTGGSAGALTLDSTVSLGSQVISSGGGTFSVPSGILSGFTIKVPTGAFSDSRTFSVSYSSIKNQTFGANFDPITPLIMIQNGGGYADSVCTVRIPCKVGAGKFAMAFAYSTVTQEIEALSTVEADSTHITAAVGSFNMFARSSTAMRKGSVPQDATDDGVGIVVSQIDSSKLANGSSSAFLPGVDDWEFVNWGSTVQPGGQCDGQSVAAIWYYDEQHIKSGLPSLNGQYDNDGNSPKTPKIRQDDTRGYKLCSMLQGDNIWSSSTVSNILGMFGQSIPIVSDALTMKGFTYALMITHSPQLVGIYSQYFGSGHSMIVYQTTGGQMMFADPNYPNDLTRHVNYVGGSFGTYNSGPNANSLGTIYTHFYYLGTKSLVRWHSIDSRWAEFLNGTIGNGTFPAFTIKANDTNDNFVPLTDGFFAHGRLTVSPNPPGPGLKIANVFNQAQANVDSTTSIPLAKGSQLLGFYITDQQNHWAGFQWVRVTSDEGGSEQGVIMPLAVGNRWVYSTEQYDTNGVLLSTFSDSIMIADSVVQGSRAWYVLSGTFWNGAALANMQDGLFWYLQPSPYEYAKYPASVNDTFGTLTNPGNSTIGDFSTTSISDNLFLPDGSSPACYVYQEQIRDLAGRLLNPSQLDSGYLSGSFSATGETLYWAPGIGCVKEEDYACSENGVQYISQRRRITSWTLH